MSEESSKWLNTMTLIGYTDKRGSAWHYRASEQGTEPNHFPGAIPVEAVRRRLFDWEPVEGSVQTSYTSVDGQVHTITDPTRKTIINPKTGDVLGVPKKGYQVHGYGEWLIENVEKLLDADLKIGSAGLLKLGAVGWVQIEMEDTLEAAGVKFRPFLTAATSLDGSMSTTYGTGAQVVVCDNTLQMAARGFDQSLKIKHSVNSLGQLTKVRDALGLVITTGDDFIAQIEALNAKRVSPKLWDDFVKAYTAPAEKPNKLPGKAAVTRAENNAEQLHRLWRSDPRVAPWKGTEYGVLAAVNTHAHHEVNTRSRGKAERNAEFTIRGQWAKQDTQALDLLGSLR